MSKLQRKGVGWLCTFRPFNVAYHVPAILEPDGKVIMHSNGGRVEDEGFVLYETEEELRAVQEKHRETRNKNGYVTFPDDYGRVLIFQGGGRR